MKFKEWTKMIFPFESKWLALPCIVGYAVLSTTLLWVHGDAPQGAFITKLSLSVSVIILLITLSIRLRANVISRVLLISSGWIGALIAWMVCVWSMPLHQRVLWIEERLEASIWGIAIFLVLAALFYLAAWLIFYLIIRRPPTASAVWGCLVLALFTYSSFIWYNYFFPL